MPRSKLEIPAPVTVLPAWLPWLLVLGGTGIRFCYGVYAHPWLLAPDQLAWQMGLDEMVKSGKWSVLQLGHAPHEGGSVLVGLFSIPFGNIKSVLPPLSIVALLLDTLIRFLQVRIAQAVFGPVTALWFGCWAVLSVPLLLPWAVVDFGLHYLASIFPFVFFWLISKQRLHKYFPVWLGICCALAASFSYENCLLLIPAAWVILHDLDKPARSMLQFSIVLVLLMLPHILLRLVAATGYPFEQGILAGRMNELAAAIHPGYLLGFWFAGLPGAFLVGSSLVGSLSIQLCLVLLCVVSGILLFLRNNPLRWHGTMIVFVVLFLLLYTLSPFAVNNARSSSFTVYRHLSYIIPFFVLLMIDGFSRSRLRYYWLAVWLLVCTTASIAFMQRPYADEQTAYRAAGWILVQKYGADIPHLFQLQATAMPLYHRSIATGFGWGLAAAMLRVPGDTTSAVQLRSLIRQSPAMFRADMISGVQYAFASGVTPKLPSRSLQQFNALQ